ncbi:MAG: alpha/beta hydrolase, partial [Oscillospiraceae bacterium]|nr:alpha/beta hydrolase [Oscillospiraceae bacterium]
MEIKKQTILTDDGVELAYLENGSGEETVVLLAGFGAPAISWVNQVDALTAAGVRTIAFDRRCHGLSEHTAKNLTMLRQGADV